MLAEPRYAFGAFVVDPRRRLLLKHGRVVRLRSKALDLLIALIERRDRVVEKSELLDLVWQGTVVSENTLAVSIAALRKVLGDSRNGGDDPRCDRLIVTVSGRGYRFVSDIRPCWDLPGAEPAATRFDGRSRLELGLSPLLPVGGTDADRAAAMALRDVLVARLTNDAQVPVRFTPGSGTGRRLGTGTRMGLVLGGSIQVAGDRLRAALHLTDPATKRVTWARCLDAGVGDTLGLQDAVCGLVAQRLRDQGLVHREAASAPSAAERACQRGRAFWNRRTPEGFRLAIAQFERALQLDAACAAAHVGLADCYNLEVLYGVAASRYKRSCQARYAAHQALAIDDRLPAAHASLGFSNLIAWDWPNAQREFEVAIDLDPGYAVAHSWYADYLLASGNVTAAIEEVGRASTLEPLSAVLNTNAGIVAFRARAYADAVERFRTALELDENFSLARAFLGLALAQQGDLDEARATCERAARRRTFSQFGLAALGYVQARLGLTAPAERILKGLQREKTVRFDLLAAIHLALGRRAAALDCLRHAAAARHPHLMWLKVEPLFDAVRDSGEFRALLARLGFRAT
jgi:DNA-binding winged helix-turn-helix (wHTH) protein/tetratricopeptide (TPR) repeat protein